MNNFKDLLTIENIRNLTISRKSSADCRDYLTEIRINNNIAKVVGYMGSGGTKEVFDILIGEERYALGLCGIIDPPQTIIKKWTQVFNEPENTSKLRELGFFVNNLCKITPIKVNGFDFPAIIMKRYQDHYFQICDGKNNQNNENMLIPPKITIETCAPLFTKIASDISNLIKAGVRIGGDCFNLCLDNNVQHLYFNDLGSASFKEIKNEDIDLFVSSYTSHAVGAFLNSSPDTKWLDETIYRIVEVNGPLEQRVKEQVYNKL